MHVCYKKMLDDLQELSDAYMSENREITRRGHQGNLAKGSPSSNGPNDSLGITYGESETSRRQDQILRQGGMDYDFPTQAPSYTMATTQQGYPAASTSVYPQNVGGAYAGLNYTPETAYGQGTQYGAPQGTGYGTGYTTGNARPATNENYTYGNESPRNDAYRQPSAYPSTGRAAAARPLDPRDPRADPRFAQVDPRGDPRMDPRMIQGGYPSYSSSGDVDPRYEYVSATPPVQSGRGGPSYPSNRVPTGYEPRDAYRNEPIREERRRR